MLAVCWIYWDIHNVAAGDWNIYYLSVDTKVAIEIMLYVITCRFANSSSAKTVTRCNTYINLK